MFSEKISLGEISSAYERIKSYISETPLILSNNLTEQTGKDIFLKFEHLQKTGSFKIRGATNAILRLNNTQKNCGVVGVSTGNHGRGLAAAAKAAGIRCIICMSELVPQNKVDNIKALGAEVRIIGKSQDEAQLEVDILVKNEGMTMIPPFDHPDVINGQGTIALEILKYLPKIDLALIPVSGGGLISGVAAAIKCKLPNCKIVGVSMERGAAMYQSQKVGKPILVKEEKTLADSLGGGIGLNNEYTFKIVEGLVDDLILVSEAEISEAIRYAYWKEGQIIEGSGAVTLASLISKKIRPKDKTIALMCGGNIDIKLHHKLISQNAKKRK